jgi:hypothetical protein
MAINLFVEIQSLTDKFERKRAALSFEKFADPFPTWDGPGIVFRLSARVRVVFSAELCHR